VTRRWRERILKIMRIEFCFVYSFVECIRGICFLINNMNTFYGPTQFIH